MGNATRTTTSELTQEELEWEVLSALYHKGRGGNATPGEIRTFLSQGSICCEAETLGCTLAFLHLEGMIDMSMADSHAFDDIETRFRITQKGAAAATAENVRANFEGDECGCQGAGGGSP